MGQKRHTRRTLQIRTTCLPLITVAGMLTSVVGGLTTVAKADDRAAQKLQPKAAIEKHHPLPDVLLKTGTVKESSTVAKDSGAAAKNSVKPSSPEITKAPAVPAAPKEWTVAEIEAAKAHCTAALKGLDAVAVPEQAKREGSCGTPAPFRLLSLGAAPQVAFDPPPLLTCDMIVGLSKWLKQDLQPLAKKHLASQIIKIETMSDYSCRAAYGRVGGKWSEHAFANALDIRGFVTAKAEVASVLDGWGPTGRDVLAAAKAASAAAKVAAIKDAAAAATKAAAAQAAPASTQTPPPMSTANATAGTTTSSTASSLPSLFESTISPLPPSAVDPANTGFGFKPPSQLGGPKDNDAPTLGPKGQTSAFLRAAHASACKIFGTTLGPEANNAHRNHFHVDMAPRKTTKYCE
jgi:hypothetical protein